MAIRSATGAARPRHFARDAHHFFGRRDALVDQALAVLAHRAQAARPRRRRRAGSRRRGCGSARAPCRRRSSARRRRCGPCSRCCRNASQPTGCQRPRASRRLQCGHSLRTRRCASTPSSDELSRNGSTPMSISRVTLDGASLVCTRGQHQVAGERGLDRDLRGLEVADLADHDHVGVLAQDRAQRLGEREVDLRVDLRLADAGQLVLDRVLDRQDVGGAGVDAAAARRTAWWSCPSRWGR